MVIDTNRFFSGIILVTALLFFFIFKLDYILLALIFLFVIYDLYKSDFINNAFDIIFIIIFILSLIIISNNIQFILIFNSFLIFCIFINLFLKNFYFKKFFLLSSLIFVLNFFTVFLIDREYLYFVIFVAFFNDTIAYIFGKSLKGPLIIPSVSPNKTWSGTLLSFSLTFLLLFQYDISLFIAILLSLSLFFGDIFFSFVKRKNNLKDFSNLLKGHGGMLDRLDSMFFFVIIFNLNNLI